MNRFAAAGVRAAMERSRLAVPAILTLLVLAACDVGGPTADAEIAVHAGAGPVCPVETDPPDPNCAPRDVAEAPVFVMPADGRDIVIAEGRTDAAGRLSLSVPAGDYLVVGGEVEGLMGPPAPVAVSVAADRAVEVELAYDTGIR